MKTSGFRLPELPVSFLYARVLYNNVVFLCLAIIFVGVINFSVELYASRDVLPFESD